MRFVQIESAEPGMRVARDLQDSYGSRLLTKDSHLTRAKIDKLALMGFAGVYIADEISDDIEIEEMISFETRAKGLECIKNSDIDGCKEVSDDIVEEIMNKGAISLDITDLRSFDDFTYAHSVNVAIYACSIGIGLGYRSVVLSQLVLAALLHDIGKMEVPKLILHKGGRLSPAEYQLMKEHPVRAYNMIKDRKDISDAVKEAVLHHHENIDGSGYPKGTEGKDQSIYTKILHVADVYDALISKRPYKAPYSPYEAVEYLMGACSIMFDQESVHALVRYVPLFPKGTEVLLSNGKRGVIYENSGFHNLRPILKLFDGTKIDLSEEEYVNVVIKPLVSVEYQDMEKAESSRNQMVHSSKTPQILVIDHMIDHFQTLRSILGDKYELTYAKSATHAINHLAHSKIPDLILLDTGIPDIDGIDLVRIIRNKHGLIPFLFVASENDKEIVAQCRGLSRTGYIIKPYKGTFLRAEIDRILNGQDEYE